MPALPQKIQRIELPEYFHPIHCPFCGKQIGGGYEDEAETIATEFAPCDHTLFIASDGGFEYISDFIVELFDLESPEKGPHAFVRFSVDEIEEGLLLEGSIMFAFYGPPQVGFFGAYIGFSQIPVDEIQIRD
ncbi:MAG: hypothetical protein CMN76_12855 [Spirochaetaceae bacterium]|nr:hypothetical protein [Spirochaetaceae bacterium]|tara:strand:+ start:22241 stop:22636 length:396 start_codon:yes stop_codon:yes gene_type:complete